MSTLYIYWGFGSGGAGFAKLKLSKVIFIRGHCDFDFCKTSAAGSKYFVKGRSELGSNLSGIRRIFILLINRERHFVIFLYQF